MILRTLKSNHQYNLFWVPLFGILFWLKNLVSPVSYNFFPGENENVLFAPLYNLLSQSPLLQVILSLVLVIVIAFLMQMLNTRFAFIRVRTKLVPILFVLIIAGFTEMHTLHSVYFAILFLIFALYSLFGTFDKSKPYSSIFNAGFFLGIGSLFYLNLIVLIPAFIFGVGLLSKDSKWRGYVILLIGFFVPVLFAYSYAVLAGQTFELLETFKNNIFTPVNHFPTNIPLYVLLAYLTILTIAGSVKIAQQYDSKKVSTRKYFTIFFILFICSLLSYLFIPGASQEILIIASIPVTFLVSNFFVFMNKRLPAEILFILLLLVIIFMQFSDKFVLNG